MTDLELLNILKTNPERAIHELMTRYGGAVSTICRNFLYDCSEDDVEEAIADTFIHFWRHRDSFTLKPNYSVKSYLYAIARNAATDIRRKQKKADIFSIEELSLDLPSEFHLENELERKECEAILHTCLEQMKEPDKSVFLYRYFYGYGIQEIAAMLSLSKKQVENLLYRGKDRLRRDLMNRGIFHG